MKDEWQAGLAAISRRSFLKGSGLFLLSLACLPSFRPENLLAELDLDETPPSMGRIVQDDVRVYRRPNLNSTILKTYWKDLVMPITEVTIGGSEPSYNRVWYKMNDEGYVHSGSVQPVEVNPQEPVTDIPGSGLLAEVCVPFTDAIWNKHYPENVAYRFYYRSTFWLTDYISDDTGEWVQVYDDDTHISLFANPRHFRIFTAEDLAPLSPRVPENKKRIEVSLADQAMVAYEYDEPVFVSRVATGGKFANGNYPTPTGNFEINHKRPSRHMAWGNLASPLGYDLPGVPWVCFFTPSGVSFHGTYWHNDFGKPRSHGCVNLSMDAALWVYRWSLPQVPLDEQFMWEGSKTKVVII